MWIVIICNLLHRTYVLIDKKRQHQIALQQSRADGGGMKPFICTIMVMLFVAVTQIPSYAITTGTMYCDGRIVSIGDTAGEVIGKCGQPAYTLQHEQKIIDDNYPAGRIITTVIVDDWTFNFGPDRFQYHLLLKNGRVAEIESLDYGY